MGKTKVIEVFDIEVKVKGLDSNSYISLTDIARYKNPEEPKDIVKNWLRNKNTIEFLGLWEKLHNPNFKGVEFDTFKNAAGSNAFVLSPQRWITSTNAIGITSKSGRYGGTFAHQDIAFEFASWVSSEFKLYLIKEFQTLKEDQYKRRKLEWETSRILSKLNYKIHTEAIKQNIIPSLLDLSKQSFTYASEADLLNLALFGLTAKQWRDINPNKKGNIRDHARLEQLIVLSNLESMNAEYIKQKIPAQKRLLLLNKIAIDQLNVLADLPINLPLEEKK